MHFLTSLSPSRVERQKYCIETWTKHATKIIAVQTSSELSLIESLYPDLGIEFQTARPSSSFSKPTPKIVDILQYATEPSLLINSDISIKDESLDLWNYEEGIFKLGIRQDYFPHSTQKRFKQKYGIDAFLIYPEMVKSIPDYDFCIGCPGWDFWLPYHLWSRQDYQIQTPECRFYHELHPIGWTKEDQTSYRARLASTEYKLTPTMLASFILDITNRHHLKHVHWS